MSIKQIIDALEKLARDIEQQQVKLSVEVREGGKQSQEGFERVLRAIHIMHNAIQLVPEKLNSLANKLRKSQ